jgi:hypothetical protein
MPTSPKGGRCPFHLGRLLPDADRSMAACSATSTSARVRPSTATRAFQLLRIERRFFGRNTECSHPRMRRTAPRNSLQYDQVFLKIRVRD